MLCSTHGRFHSFVSGQYRRWIAAVDDGEYESVGYTTATTGVSTCVDTDSGTERRRRRRRNSSVSVDSDGNEDDACASGSSDDGSDDGSEDGEAVSELPGPLRPSMRFRGGEHDPATRVMLDAAQGRGDVHRRICTLSFDDSACVQAFVDGGYAAPDSKPEHSQGHSRHSGLGTGGGSGAVRAREGTTKKRGREDALAQSVRQRSRRDRSSGRDGRHSDTGSGDEGGEAPVENLEDVLWNASLHFQ